MHKFYRSEKMACRFLILHYWGQGAQIDEPPPTVILPPWAQCGTVGWGRRNLQHRSPFAVASGFMWAWKSVRAVRYGHESVHCVSVCGSKLSFSSDDMNARDFFVDRGANLQSSLLHVSPSLSELRAAPDFFEPVFVLGCHRWRLGGLLLHRKQATSQLMES